MKEYTQKGQKYWEQEKSTEDEKGIHDLKRGIRKTGMEWLRGKKESRREKPWIKLPYATTPNSHELVRMSGAILWWGT